MTKELEQAADEWVEKYAFRVPYDGSNEFYDKEADKHGRAGFIAGATSPAAKAYWEQQGINADFLLWLVVNKWEYDFVNHKWFNNYIRDCSGLCLNHNELYQLYMKTNLQPSPPKTDKQ